MSTPEKYSDDQIWTLLRKYDHQRVSYKKLKKYKKYKKYKMIWTLLHKYNHQKVSFKNKKI